ncbi:1-deoxy-D-xylulose-5-phosphate synthase [Flaviflexus equikiangi]|uniref:1-deoxy-D-xylulose-5-phosphate synthase n=1 Tax=Flaviflexus equikiangi TaxID=2758573 RepID=A0ABS2TG61_9ACTO|nr:1-deoxy-D-xylulose-5-phosphate synthase [Flaviflexus equikiangi]MBM9433353.1 1-deoxy-D-xylulose-5-phosphate synthase [Flaviflexus equikiangi]
MNILSTIHSPADVSRLDEKQRAALAQEIRTFLVESVSQTGGHLGPNLGVVELTIALHRIFDSPRDTIVFDTGHQSYVHKILTGRQNFAGLRSEGGLSGYPSRTESPHDVVENSHASTALSWAAGIVRGYRLSGDDRCVVAVIGDGALTGGMAWEALNNIAEDDSLPIVIVVNDNDRSYEPTIGGMARKLDVTGMTRRLDQVRVSKDYENLLSWGKRTLRRSGPPGRLAYDAIHGFKKGVKDIFVNAGIFDALGLKYVGPVDGHDIDDLESALQLARDYGGPVVVHAITEKGRGYQPALDDVADRFHAVGQIHPETGLPIVQSGFGWTSVFADEILAAAEKDPSIVALTAAMLRPVGLGPMRDRFPDRVIDIGIAEQHALTTAAGLAYAGYHPVVALYATFLNRAYDQLLMDVALHRAPVTVVLDRAGITGNDGASHNGMWDLALAAMIPGLRVAAPRDEKTLRTELNEALAVDDGPTMIRYPKGTVADSIPAIDRVGDIDVLGRNEGDGHRILVVGVGAMAPAALDALSVETADVTVVDPRWVLPVSQELVDFAEGFDAIVTIEDGLREGGVGQQIAGLVDCPVTVLGVSRHFIDHASRSDILVRENMTGHDVITAVRAAAGQGPALSVAQNA